MFTCTGKSKANAIGSVAHYQSHVNC